jgi:hypothetical protein
MNTTVFYCVFLYSKLSYVWLSAPDQQAENQTLHIRTHVMDATKKHERNVLKLPVAWNAIRRRPGLF